MAEPLRCITDESIVTGWDFSTGGVKHLAFDLDGDTLARVRLPTDLWTDQETGAVELNLLQLEGQARASVRLMAERLRDVGGLEHWAVGGISATHHTAGRIDAGRTQVRRAICWNDKSLAAYHKAGLAKLGGPERVQELIGGPWAIRYTLSHLVKDETTLDEEDWRRTYRILPHGPLAAGYLTGNFGVTSVSSAASTGIMDLRSCRWEFRMLEALKREDYRRLAERQLPRIVGQFQLVGRLADHLAREVGLDPARRPLIFPTSDDQQAGLCGGGAVEDGQLAVVLGNSAVVNSSSERMPASGSLDVMRLNWGPYLWMRCFNNGAQFLDAVVGKDADWEELEREGSNCPPGVDGVTVLPFAEPEPSLDMPGKCVKWDPGQPTKLGSRFRAALEALAYLVAGGVREHEEAGQRVLRITVSGGIARSELMCKVLASVLDRRLERLVSDEGPALGAAATGLAALETHRRRRCGIEAPFTVADAVARMVRFREPVEPVAAWREIYRKGLARFRERVAAKPC